MGLVLPLGLGCELGSCIRYIGLTGRRFAREGVENWPVA